MCVRIAQQWLYFRLARGMNSLASVIDIREFRAAKSIEDFNGAILWVNYEKCVAGPPPLGLLDGLPVPREFT